MYLLLKQGGFPASYVGLPKGCLEFEELQLFGKLGGQLLLTAAIRPQGFGGFLGFYPKQLTAKALENHDGWKITPWKISMEPQNGGVVGVFGVVTFRYLKFQWSRKIAANFKMCRYFLVGSWGDLFVYGIFFGDLDFYQKVTERKLNFGLPTAC